MCDCETKCPGCKCDEGEEGCSIEVVEECWACGKIGKDVKGNICDDCEDKAKKVVEEMLRAGKKGNFSKVQELLVEHTQMRRRRKTS